MRGLLSLCMGLLGLCARPMPLLGWCVRRGARKRESTRGVSPRPHCLRVRVRVHARVRMEYLGGRKLEVEAAPL